MADNVKVYTVNGAATGSSSSLPDWLTRKRAANGKGKRAIREHVEGTIQLIQGFEFPEASNKIKTTRDGTHVIATGTYKPQMRVWDLDQLSMKFERHTDAENIDFVMLSDDWTKSIHLQNDRSVELHTQGGHHYRTRIPRFGRSIAYHFPSCDALVSAFGNEIYRLNLDQGRFMTPLVLQDDQADIVGVNVIDVNPAHQLLAFGIDGSGSVHFWDPRSRTSVGVLRLPANRLTSSDAGLSVSAIASRADGLTYAIGTTTGHTLLYDIRSSQPFATKDQGYGLPVNNLAWIEGGSRMAGDGMVLSADKKVIKIWDRNMPSSNFVSITPASDLNDVHHIPGSGLLLTANESIEMGTFYIPQLGPAPKWASFLENITEEMEDQALRSVYEDYKFVERSELKTLGLDHLIGTPTLKPYMHGYFVSFKLFEAAKLIANPFEYAEHHEKIVRDKMDKLAETRIRAKKANATQGVKVNKALAEKILREEERAAKKLKRVVDRKGEAAGDVDKMEVDKVEEGQTQTKKSASTSTLLSDPRFAQVFEDPAFAIDEQSREFALLNPSGVAQRSRAKTAVEDEEDESDKISSDGLGGDCSDTNSDDSGNSSDDGELTKFDRRSRPGQQNSRAKEVYERQKALNRQAGRNVNMVPMQINSNAGGGVDRNATFGQRRTVNGKGVPRKSASGSGGYVAGDGEGGMEMSWVPSSASTANRRDKKERKGVERFGAGMERGGESSADVVERERQGRTKRRQGVRSGSKNVFRKMG